MDTAQWPEGFGVVKSMEEKKAIRAQKPQALNCPRCNSTHTKFCYYNNYNLSQPRYFCKTCRRYWTAGGSLRNVPVGGGSRKNRRSSSSPSSPSPSPSAAVAAASIPASKNDHQHMMLAQPAPNLISENPSQHIIQNHGGQDLNLAYTNTTTSSSSATGFLNGGNGNARGMMMMMMNSFAGSSNTMMMNSPGLHASLDGFENGGAYDDHDDGFIRAINHQDTASTTTTAPCTSARLFLPFEDLKPVSASTSESEVQGDHSNCNGYWSGGLGGGSW